MTCHDSTIAKCAEAALRAEAERVARDAFPRWYALSGVLARRGRGACAGVFGEPARRPHSAAPAMMPTRVSVIV